MTRTSARLRGMAGFSMAAALLAPVSAVAQQQTFLFDIPAQDLDGALRAFSRTSRQQILFDGDLVQNKQSRGLQGAYTAEHGLSILLKGTGLDARRGSQGAYVLGAVRVQPASLLVPMAATSDAAAFTPQDAPERASTIEELIVTAQKREQSINSVGMAISAVTGPGLAARGVNTSADLNKVVAGLSVVPNGTGQTGTPVYTLRGIGFNEVSISALSAVSFSHDDMPLPYPMMTAGPSLDLQRVEVLKGPQGTLYGQNSTGGAINFFSNKPTGAFAAGGEIGYGRFDAVDVSGFVSGPLSDTLSARLALRSITADGWQTSLSRPGDRLGAKDSQAARLILDWAPTERLRLELNLNGWVDRSDSQAAQLIGVNPSIPVTLTGAPFTAANYPAFDALFARPVAPPSSARAADWTPGLDYRNDNRFGQVGLRADWNLTSNVTLTSITAASFLHYETFTAASGTPTTAFNFGGGGSIEAYSQEVRLSGLSFDERLNWIAGVNFARDIIHDNQYAVAPTSTVFSLFGITSTRPFNNEVRTTQAGFASADFDLTPTLTLTGGVRYTAHKLRMIGCTADNGDGTLARAFTGGAVGPGQCITFLNQTGPGFGPVQKHLDEDNVAWRIGVNYEPADDTLLYANVSRGFKGGNFPTIGAVSENQYDPVVQEQVTSYEAGIKARPFGDLLQLNAAVYHSDYVDKQLFVFILNELFGTEVSTVNIPKSVVNGAEIEATLRPLAGLTLQANVTYTKTKITTAPDCTPQTPNYPFTPTCIYAGYSYVGYPAGPPNALLDLKGERFNLSPTWQANFNAEYQWRVSEALGAFVGASVVYQSSQTSTIGASTGQVVAGRQTIDQTIPAYTTLDLRGGVESKDGRWRLTVWGRNVTNTFYVTNIARGLDQVVRWTGMPATFGATLGISFP